MDDDTDHFDYLLQLHNSGRSLKIEEYINIIQNDTPLINTTLQNFPSHEEFCKSLLMDFVRYTDDVKWIFFEISYHIGEYDVNDYIKFLLQIEGLLLNQMHSEDVKQLHLKMLHDSIYRKIKKQLNEGWSDYTYETLQCFYDGLFEFYNVAINLSRDLIINYIKKHIEIYLNVNLYPKLRKLLTSVCIYLYKLSPKDVILSDEIYDKILKHDSEGLLQELSTSYQPLAYYLISYDSQIFHTPRIYSTCYKMQRTLVIALIFLKSSNEYAITNGFVVLKGLINRKYFIPFEYMDLVIFQNIWISFENACYELKRRSVDGKFMSNLISDFMTIFDDRSKYAIVLNMWKYSITDFMSWALKDTIRNSISTNNSVTDYFKGKKLIDLCKIIPGNEDTENPKIHQILDALNFYYFIFDFDKENVTNIWNYKSHFVNVIIPYVEDVIKSMKDISIDAKMFFEKNPVQNQDQHLDVNKKNIETSQIVSCTLDLLKDCINRRA